MVLAVCFLLAEKHLGLGMSLPVNFFQALNSIVGIYLGCCQACMPQQLFYSINIGAFVGKMGSKSMPENMGAFFLDGCDQGKVLFYN